MKMTKRKPTDQPLSASKGLKPNRYVAVNDFAKDQPGYREPKKPTHAETLDALGIDAVCERIEGDESLASIAADLGIPKSTLTEWIQADLERSTRAHASRIISSEACDDHALRAIKELPSDGTPAQIAKARELASHYRWRAKMRDPARYGDKQQVEHSGAMTLEQLVVGSQKPSE